jgi:choloylglycine hydrolase
VVPVQLSGLKLAQFGQGSGLHGLPGDYTSPSRFVRAAVFSQSAIPSDNTRDEVLQAFHILNAFDIPLGAVRASEDGGMIAEYTTWTSAADLKDLTWSFRTYHDQSIRSVELRAALAAANGRMRTIPMDSHQPVQDVSTSFK